MAKDPRHPPLRLQLYGEGLGTRLLGAYAAIHVFVVMEIGVSLSERDTLDVEVKVDL